jgi:hypothetical protein
MAAAGQRRRPALADFSAMAADWRNRLIGSRRVQRWAAAFPLTRRLARRDGERLFDLMAGFVYSQTLLACVELGLLRRLRGGPRHSGELAGLLGLEEDLGKPCGQDAAHGRPNAVADFGVAGAIRRLEDILGGAIASIPACPGEAALCAMVRKQAERLTPVAPARSVA